MNRASIHQHQFDNGLHLLAESIPTAESVALSILTPAGVATEPDNRQGIAAMLAEMICRGAGGLDARAHSNALDALGVQRGTAAEITRLHVGATLVGNRLAEALPLLCDMVLRPMLPESALEPSRDLALQSLDALDDEPQQRVFVELCQRHYPAPFGRSPLGIREHLEKLTLADIREFWRQGCVPGGSVIGVAGKFDWDALRDQVGTLTRDWRGRRPEPVDQQLPPRGYRHIKLPTTQVHIGLAYDAPPATDPASDLQRAAAAVLSGGMSGRLFTEVREKRGLVYSVDAAYSGHQRHGAMRSYAGTTAPRAQETLDVLTGELRRMSQGVDEGEFNRAIVGMKSRLVMSGESTTARAHAIAADQVILGHPRSLDELASTVDAITRPKLNQYLRQHPPGPMTIVTIGPAKLNVT